VPGPTSPAEALSVSKPGLTKRFAEATVAKPSEAATANKPPRERKVRIIDLLSQMDMSFIHNLHRMQQELAYIMFGRLLYYFA
jgi:hypothetical protein